MYKIEDLTSQDLQIIATAIDFYLCNLDHDEEHHEEIENLFVHVDLLAESAEQTSSNQPLFSSQGNLLRVDFRSKKD